MNYVPNFLNCPSGTVLVQCMLLSQRYRSQPRYVKEVYVVCKIVLIENWAMTALLQMLDPDKSLPVMSIQVHCVANCADPGFPFLLLLSFLGGGRNRTCLIEYVGKLI